MDCKINARNPNVRFQTKNSLDHLKSKNLILNKMVKATQKSLKSGLFKKLTVLGCLKYGQVRISDNYCFEKIVSPLN